MDLFFYLSYFGSKKIIKTYDFWRKLVLKKEKMKEEIPEIRAWRNKL